MFEAAYRKARVGWRFAVRNDAEWGMASSRGWRLTLSAARRAAQRVMLRGA